MTQHPAQQKETDAPFLDRFGYQVFRFARNQELIDSGDRILVSISGGVDSVCLLHLLCSFKKKIELELHLVHFHHGLRKASDEEELFIRNLSRQTEIPLTVIRSTDLKNKKGMQNLARQWRQKHLEEIRSELGFDKIATGHHLDDLVETQIWRLMRGASLFSLNPIQAKNLPYIRPLLNQPKEDLVRYLLHHHWEWREDLSNETDDYTRNMIRNRLLPVMKESSGDKFLQKMLALSTDAHNLKQYFDQQFPRHLYEKETIPYQLFASLNPLFGCELIHRFLLHHGQNELSRDNIQRIYKLAQSGKGNWSLDLKNGTRICGYNKSIRIENKND